MTGTNLTESEKVDLLCEHVNMRIDDITSNNVNSIVADIYVSDAKSMLEAIRSLQQQVNTLTEALNRIKWDAEKAQFVSLNGAQNFAEYIQNVANAALQSIKESPREEQT